MRLWVCIALPQLALDCVLRGCENPLRPLVLLGGPAQRRVLLAVNDAARQQGLRPGQRLSHAQAMAEGFTALEHDPASSERCRQWLAGWACRYTDQVCTDWPDSLLLEVGGSLPWLGGWPACEASLRAGLQALGLQHRLALAPTLRAAHLFAWLGDGYAFTGLAGMHEALRQVPVRRAALPDDAGRQLHRMGIRQLGQLFDLPRDGLQRRFGAALLRCLDRLRGNEPEPPAFWQPPDRFDMRLELPCRVESWLALSFPLRRLLADLGAFLLGRDRGVQHFVLWLEHDRRDEVAATRLPIGLLRAERDPEQLFELVASRLAQLLLPAPVSALRLLASDLLPFLPCRQELFEQRLPGRLPWAQLQERLRARLGEAALYRIEVLADHRPERAWRRCPPDSSVREAPQLPGVQATVPDSAVRPAPKRGPDQSVPAAGSGAAPQLPLPLPAACQLPRPGWLLPAPVPLATGVRRIISGPERLESGWWDGDDIRRDYYVLETLSGQRAWAYVPVGQQGPWMLHGWFA